MFSFDFKKNVFLGIDIGTASVKIVEVKVVDGRPILSNYAWMPLGENTLGKDDFNSDYFYATLPQCIKKIIKKAKIKGNNAYVSLPAFSGLINLIDFPEMAEGDMDQAIRFEAHKYIPTSLDEVVISWSVVERKDAAELEAEKEKNNNISGVMKVLLVAASKKKVLKYEGMIKAAGLRLRSLDIEAFSSVRSLIGNDLGNFVIVDIGSRICSIVLVEKGIVRISRNIDAGGVDMTKAISKEMMIDFERAETLKVSGKNFFASDSSINFFTLEFITGEVERVIKAYYKDLEKDKINEIILTGGTAKMFGLTEYFSNKLKIKTIVGNSFARVGYDEKLKDTISSMQTGFSVAVGLALKGVEEYLKKESK